MRIIYQAGALVVARSPATAVAIVKETKTAHLGFSKVILGVTVTMDLVVIVMYTLTALLCDALVSHGNSQHFLRVMAVFAAQVRHFGCFDVSNSLDACVISQVFLSTSIGALVGYFVLPLLLWHSPSLAQRKPLWDSVWSRVVQPVLFVLLGFSFFPLAHEAESFVEPLIVCMVSGFVLVNFHGHAAHERFQHMEDFLAETIHVVNTGTPTPHMHAHTFELIAINAPIPGLFHSDRRRIECKCPVEQRNHRDLCGLHARARHYRGRVHWRSIGRRARDREPTFMDGVHHTGASTSLLDGQTMTHSNLHVCRLV